MTIELAHVSKVEGEYAWVEKSAVTTCSGCVAEADCGTSVIQKYLSKSYRTVKVANQCRANKGDQVAVEIEDALLLKLSLITYLFPLCVFILGCILGNAVAMDYKNLTSMLSGGLCLVFAVVFVRVYTKWLFKRKYAPLKAVRIIS